MQDPADPPLPPHNRPAVYRPLPRLTWLLVVLLLVWLVPNVVQPLIEGTVQGIIERNEFARVRGKERAEAEVAATELPKQDLLKTLSRDFGLIARRIGPSVVHVETARIINGNGGSDELAASSGTSNCCSAAKARASSSTPTGTF